MGFNGKLGLGFVGGAPAFSPLSLSPFIWFRADLGVTLATGVSAWADQSGNGRNLIQATGALQPVYNATDVAYNNKPSVQSNSIGQFMVTAAITLAQPFCYFVVGQYDVTGNVFVGSAAEIFNNASQVASNANVTLTTSKTPATPRAILATYNGASSLISASDWLSAGTTGNAGAAAEDKMSIFATATGTAGNTGKIVEIVGLPRVPTSGDKSSLAAYFTTRYGIAIT